MNLPDPRSCSHFISLTKEIVMDLRAVFKEYAIWDVIYRPEWERIAQLKLPLKGCIEEKAVMLRGLSPVDLKHHYCYTAFRNFVVLMETRILYSRFLAELGED